MNTQRKTRYSGIVAAASLLLLTGGALAAPGTLTYSGTLVKDGTPLNGNVALSFELFDSATGGTSLWSEHHAAVDVTASFFSVELGVATPLTPSIFSGGSRWLQVVVDSQTLSPRVAITSVPYAISAANATGSITPKTVSVGGSLVIDESGKWVGDPSGLVGPAGPKGDTGAQGTKGDKGDTGAQGLKGDKGDKGDTGAQGLKGDKGDTGAQGLKGDKGDTGAQGAAGVLAAGHAGYDLNGGTPVVTSTAWVFFGSSGGSYGDSTLSVSAGNKVAVSVNAHFYKNDTNLADALYLGYGPCYRVTGSSTITAPPYQGQSRLRGNSGGATDYLTGGASYIFTMPSSGSYDFGLCARRLSSSTSYSNFQIYSPKVLAIVFN